MDRPLSLCRATRTGSLEGSVTPENHPERVFEEHRFDYVYHLAAEFGRWNGEDFYETLWTTNVVGTKNVIRLQERHRFRLIQFSSSEVYGDHEGIMSEDVTNDARANILHDLL